MARLGVELGPRAIRGVRVSGWPTARARAMEVEWDRDHPEEAVRTLVEGLGAPRRIAVAVDLRLLITKRVKLPALSASERRNILRLEPERFFAVRGEAIVPAVSPDSDLVFAAPEAPLASWVTALERIAPVDLVEPAPLALTRALHGAGLSGGVILLDGPPDGFSLIGFRDGRILRARRVFGDLDEVAAALRADPALSAPTTPAVIHVSLTPEDRVRQLGSLLSGVSLQPLPGLPTVPGPFMSAYGAALGVDGAGDFASTLISPEHGRTIRGRRRRALALAGTACAGALVFAILSADAARARATRELGARLVTLRQRAAPALALEGQLARLARRSEEIRTIEAERPDPLRVLLALSRQLPPGAFIGGLRSEGPEWQIDGYGPNAASVLTTLGGSPAFRDVHFLSAMNRAQLRNQQYESFALAFRFAAAP